MYILLLLLIPLISGLFCLIANDQKVKLLATVSSVVSLAYTGYLYLLFTGDSSQQLFVDMWWMQNLGISFKMAIDGISMLLVLLTNLLMPFIVLSTFGKEIKKSKLFYALMLFMQFALLGVFLAMDGFLFYVFWELALIPIYLICLLWGGAERVRITIKFFIYTLSGSLLMLVGMIYLYMLTPGQHSFDIDAFYQLSISGSDQSLLFWLFFLSFAIKIPIFPLHTWQPDTYTDAPIQGSMLLSGIMLKMGLYGIIRWMLPILPMGIAHWGNLAMILAIIGVVYASCLAIVQSDFKRLIAYSSVAHVGLIAAGIFTMNVEGLQGAMFQMFSHGINVVAIFFIADIIERRMNTRTMSALGGLSHNSPLFPILFLIVLLASIALPLTNGFVGEFLLLNGIYQYNSYCAAFAGLSVILGAVYMLRAYQKTMLGEPHSRSAEFTGLINTEKVILIALVVVIITTGVYPKLILNITAPAIDDALSHINTIY